MRILNPASSSTDGQGTVKAGLLRFGSVEARNLESKLRLAARHVFFTEVKAEGLPKRRWKGDRKDGRGRKTSG